MSDGTGGADRVAITRGQAGRRAPALLLLLTVLALFAGICHGAHGHALPAALPPSVPAHVAAAAAADRAPGAFPVTAAGPGARATAPVTAAVHSGAPAPSASPVPGTPTHGCHEGGDGGLPHDVHLPAAQTPAGPQLTAPDTAGAPLVAHDALFPAVPRARVRDRAGPGPAPGHLLIALGVNRN